MSALEQSDTTVRSNGAPPEQAGRIAVQNPATGEVIGQVDDMSAGAGRGRRRARAARAAGMGGARVRRARARSCTSCATGSSQNRDRVLDVLVKENGKTREDALLAEMFYVCDALGFWAKNAPQVPGRREDQDALAAAARQEGGRALSPARRGRRDRPVELPADEQLRRLHPGADGRQLGRAEAERGDAAHEPADGRGRARVRRARATSSRSSPARAAPVPRSSTTST